MSSATRVADSHPPGGSSKLEVKPTVISQTDPLDSLRTTWEFVSTKSPFPMMTPEPELKQSVDRSCTTERAICSQASLSGSGGTSVAAVGGASGTSTAASGGSGIVD